MEKYTYKKLKDDISYLPIIDHDFFELFSSTDDTYYSNTFMSCNGEGNNIEKIGNYYLTNDNNRSDNEIFFTTSRKLNNNIIISPPLDKF